MADSMRAKPGESLNAVHNAIRLAWPHRHEYFGVRIMLLSLVRIARTLS